MKRLLIALGFTAFLLTGSFTFSSCCNNDTSKTVQSKKTSEYQCPMKCEGDKTYDHPGKCPVCGMKLKEI